MAFVMTRDNIIERALELAGLKSVGTPAQLQWVLVGADELNGIIEELNSIMTSSLQMEWKYAALTDSDVVSNGGKSYKCIKSNLSSADSEPGVGSIADFYWVETTDTPSGAWVTATSYNSISDFTLPSGVFDIVTLFLQDGQTKYDPLILSDFHEYDSWDVTQEGIPQYYYIDHNAGKIYFDFSPDMTTPILKYLVVNGLATMDTASEEPAYTSGFYRYLMYALGAAMANYNPSLNPLVQQNLERQSEKAYNKIKKRDFHRS